jgi:hypothetical protein
MRYLIYHRYGNSFVEAATPEKALNIQKAKSGSKGPYIVESPSSGLFLGPDVLLVEINGRVIPKGHLTEAMLRGAFGLPEGYKVAWLKEKVNSYNGNF